MMVGAILQLAPASWCLFYHTIFRTAAGARGKQLRRSHRDSMTCTMQRWSGRLVAGASDLVWPSLGDGWASDLVLPLLGDSGGVLVGEGVLDALDELAGALDLHGRGDQGHHVR